MPARKLPKAIRRQLDDAIDSCNMENSGFSEETKRQIKAYIDTWIWLPLQAIKEYDEGERNARGERMIEFKD